MNKKYKRHTKKIAAIAVGFALISVFLLSSCSVTSQKSGGSSQPDTAVSSTTQPQTTSPNKPDGFYGYGYDNLSSKSLKELYLLIDEYANKRLSIEFCADGELSGKQVYETLSAYKNDHPEVFWLKTTYEYYYESGKTHLLLSFSMNSDTLTEAKASFNAVVDKIVKNAPKNASEFERELYINDYLCDNCEYDYEALENDEIVANENDAYGVLIDKKAVCEGYARAFQLLCSKLDLECVNVVGTADDIAHQWNCVKIGGSWYHIDTTWNDTKSDEKYAEYDYFNLNDEQMSKTHKTSSLFSELSDTEFEKYDYMLNVFIPECKSKEYNYYRQTCVTVSDIEYGDEVVNAIAQAAADKEPYLSIVLDDDLDFGNTTDKILNDGYMYSWIEKANEQNSYQPELSTSCLVYKKAEIGVLTMKLEYY